MSISGQNVKLFAGDTLEITVALTGSGGAPFTATETTQATYKVAESAHATAALITKTRGVGITFGTGTAVIELTREDTLNIAPFLYYHELKVYDEQLGDVATAMTGNFVIKRSLPRVVHALEADGIDAASPEIGSGDLEIPA